MKKIFEPINVGVLKLKNRMIVPAMVSNYCNEDGMATEKFIAYHETKAKGDWGLIIAEDYRIAEEAGASAKLPGLYDDSQIASHKKLTQRVHDAGGKIVAQIYHAGWESKKAFVGADPVGVVTVKNYAMPDMPKALTIDQIHHIVQQFAACAKRAKEAGFDGVEIHGAHGYLLEQFFSPQLNCRCDEYGGDFVGRSRLPLEVVHAVRETVGPDFPVLYRMTVAEYVEGGLGIEESKALAILLEEAGVNAINCSQGAGSMGCGTMTIPPTIIRPGAYAGHAAAIKSVVDIPVIAVGRINTPEIAEAVIRSGQADMVAMGRASIADPELPNKALAGDLAAINHCIACVQGCIGEKRRGNVMSCTVNPTVGHEAEWDFSKVKEPKKIFIAGGGVSGCEVAIAAAKRGHAVTIFEKDDHLGGQWCLAAVPVGKSEFASFVKWQKVQLERLGVEIKLNSNLSMEDISEGQPDIVVDATGSHPAIPPITGVDRDNVVTAHDVLSGKVTCGKNVAVIGGGLVGAETAEFLAYHGSRVSILEMLSEIAKDGESASNYYMMENLATHHVNICTNVCVQEITASEVVFETEDGQKCIENVDTVVIATGVKPNTDFSEMLNATGIEHYAIGDAAGVKNGFSNIQEAYKLGLGF